VPSASAKSLKTTSRFKLPRLLCGASVRSHLGNAPVAR
jgi:hypothetical protein